MPDLSSRTAWRKTAKIFLGILMAATPIFFSTAFLHFHFGATIFDYSPAYDADQYFYYNETASFSAHGLSSGYYGAGEKAAVLGGYGPHGLGYPAVTGIIAALTGGMRLYSIPLINLCFFTVALALFVICINPTAGYLFRSWLFLLTFPPLILYLPMGLQDGFHFGVAVTLAWMFYRLIRQDEEKRMGRFRWLVLVSILASCAVRHTWAFLLLPYFFITDPDSLSRPLRPLLKGGGLFLAVYFAFNLFASPWTRNLGADPALILKLAQGEIPPFLALPLENVQNLLDFKSNFYDNALSLEALAFILGAGVLLFLFRRSAASVGLSKRTVGLVALTNLAGLGLFFLAMVLVYTGSGRHLPRLVSAGFVFSFLLTLRLVNSRFLLLFILANAMLLPMTLDRAHTFLLPVYLDAKPSQELIEAFRSQSAPYIRYEEGADPWDNTILMERAHMPAYLGLPPGIGIQLLGDEMPTVPFKSRYFLLSDHGYDILNKFSPLTKVGDTFLGGIYRNAATPAKKDGAGEGGQ